MPKSFRYNYVFAPEDTQEMIYDNAIKSMVGQLFSGYNVTILAYGQTGSGKTHTMGTTFDGNLNDDIGVIPRAIEEIFDIIDRMDDHDFNVNCSFVELYQEKLYDLLSKNTREQSVVDIREIDGKIIIPNLSELGVKSTSETTDCLKQGSSDRAVGATAMNAVRLFSFCQKMQQNSNTNHLLSFNYISAIKPEPCHIHDNRTKNTKRQSGCSDNCQIPFS